MTGVSLGPASLGLLFALQGGVSYQREVAPVLAFHCHRCHGDEGVAGDLDTRTLAKLLQGGRLGPAVVPGRPERSLLLDFLEGRRGESRRMPLEAPPLGAETIAKIRQWIAEGAILGEAPPAIELRREFRRSNFAVIELTTPAKAYAELEVRGGSRLLYRAAAVVDPKLTWTLRTPKSWPSRLGVAVRLLHSQGPATPKLSVKASKSRLIQ